MNVSATAGGRAQSPVLFLLDVGNEVSETGQLKLSRVPNGTPETVFRSFSAGLDVCKVGKIHIWTKCPKVVYSSLDVCKVGKIPGCENSQPDSLNQFRCLQGGENSPPHRWQVSHLGKLL